MRERKTERESSWITAQKVTKRKYSQRLIRAVNDEEAIGTNQYLLSRTRTQRKVTQSPGDGLEIRLHVGDISGKRQEVQDSTRFQVMQCEYNATMCEGSCVQVQTLEDEWVLRCKHLLSPFVVIKN